MHSRLVPTAALVLLLTVPAAAQEYTATTATDLYAAPQGTTTIIPSDRDDVTVSVELPFEFAYYGRLYDELSVCSNGWLALGETTATNSANVALPGAATPNGVIAPLWDDLVTRDGSVVTSVEGTAPTRAFVVTWLGVDTFSGASDDDLTFQVRLFEGTGVIELAYASGGTYGAVSYTAGIEDETGTLAVGAPNLRADNTARPATDQRLIPRPGGISGRLLRDRPVADATGLGNSEETDLPLVDVSVVAVRTDDGGLLARAQTGPDGGFDLRPLGVPAGVRVDIQVRVEGEAARVTRTTGAIHSFTFAVDVAADTPTDVGTTTFDVNTDGSSSTLRPALNIHQAMTRALGVARDFAVASAAPTSAPVETFPALQVRWEPGRAIPNGGMYVPENEVAVAVADIDGTGDVGDAYDDDVVLREYGHHVFARISTHPGALGTRSLGQPTTDAGAWVDGFATWFATEVQGRSVFIDTKGPDAADVFDLAAATPRPTATPDTTGAVALSLFDLVDPADADHDRFAGTRGPAPSTSAEVFATIDQDLDEAPAGTSFDVFDFFDAWREDGDVVDRQATARLFIHHGSLADDAFEPNDDAGEERDFPAETQRLDALTLNPFNSDRFNVELGGDGSQPLVVSLEQTRTTDLVLTVEDALGTEIATATTQGAADKTELTATAPVPTAPGNYVVRVDWVGGAPTSYSLSFGTPLRLAAAALPTWTAGEPFKEDLVALGGIAPYTFDLDATVPGLTTANAGTRVEGTPTTAGDFELALTVTDSSSPAGRLQLTVPLRIEPALRLASTAGLVQGRAEMVVLGTGGTLAEWTANSAVPAGLTLIGGAELQVTGSAAAAGLVDLTESATDSVGASLTDAPSRLLIAPFVALEDSVPVPPGDEFAIAFDALTGSSADLGLRFRGTGARPTLVRVMTADGRELAPSTVRTKRRRVNLRGIDVAESGTLFAVFANDGSGASPFSGTVQVEVDARPPRRVVGQVAIDDFLRISTVTFQGVAGSRVTLRARRGLAPSNLQPLVFSLTDPDGEAVALPQQARSRRGKRIALRGIELPKTGTYTISFTGEIGTFGPLRYSIRQRFARGVGVDLSE